MNLISLAEAEEKGYIPYSGPYHPEEEKWMVENALHDIAKNRRDRAILVEGGIGIEIHIVPNFYKNNLPYVTTSQISVEETVRDNDETLEKVEDSEERTATLQREAKEATRGIRYPEGKIPDGIPGLRVLPNPSVQPSPPPERKGGWDANGSPILDGGVL